MSEKEQNLMEQLLRVYALMHKYRHQSRRDMMQGDPHRGQGRVLALLKMRPDISQKELSYILDMRTQSSGEILAKLEKNGCITRTPSEKDRRVMDIHLTEEGAKAAEEVEKAQRDSGKMFDFLTDEEQEQLSALLGRVAEGLNQGIGEESGGDCREGCGFAQFGPKGGFPWGIDAKRGYMREMRWR